MPEPRTFASSEQVVRTARRMYEMRATAKQIFGAQYRLKVAPFMRLLDAAQQRYRCDVIPALMTLAREAEQRGTPLADGEVLLLTSAAVEMSETDRILEKIPNA